MPDQPDLEKRIADVMRKHRFERHSESSPGEFAWWGHCTGCGAESLRRSQNGPEWELNMRDDEVRHIAEVLVSELGLTQNTATVRSNAGWLTHPGTKAGDVMVRYVTEWKRA